MAQTPEEQKQEWEELKQDAKKELKRFGKKFLFWFVVAGLSLTVLIFAVKMFFDYVFSGTFGGTVTGIVTLAAIFLFFFLVNRAEKRDASLKAEKKRKREEEEARKLREEVHQRELKRLEEKQAEQRKRTDEWIQQMKADGLGFEEMSRKMFGYDDDYDAMDPDEI